MEKDPFLGQDAKTRYGSGAYALIGAYTHLTSADLRSVGDLVDPECATGKRGR